MRRILSPATRSLTGSPAETLTLPAPRGLLPGGGFGFTDLVAAGQHGSARLNGDYGRDKVDLNARIDVPEAQVLDPRVAGKARNRRFAEPARLPISARSQSHARRRAAARSQDVRPHARGARQPHHWPCRRKRFRCPATSTACPARFGPCRKTQRRRLGRRTISRSASPRRVSLARSRIGADRLADGRTEFQRRRISTICRRSF